ncbi:hypothetical protein T484DRAFT_1791219 [Baffinella frigidus]|nr:hypothetical protein T484DRAFT_1791219 [Cryptophyta sp. CCMP2293]
MWTAAHTPLAHDACHAGAANERALTQPPRQAAKGLAGAAALPGAAGGVGGAWLAGGAGAGGSKTPDRSFFLLLAQELMQRGLSEFKPQELSNLLWALTTPAGHKPMVLYTMAELELTTERDLSRFNPQDLSNLATSLAAFGVPTSRGTLAPGLEAVAAEMLRPTTIESGGAFADMSDGDEGEDTQFAARDAERRNKSAGGEARPRLGSFSPGQLAAVAMAYAKAASPATSLFQALISEMCSRVTLTAPRT